MSDANTNCPKCNARPETTRIGALVSLKCTECRTTYLALPRVPEAPVDWDERFIGQRCGNCHLVSRVAVEEDGPVYEGLHVGLNQPVHVKILAPDLASDPQMAKRFVRQAQLAAKVIHPKVPRVLDIGPSQDVPYIIRERAQGQRLSAERNGSAPSVEDLTAALPKIAEALSAVHDAGIVHLNVKPHSIILTEEKDIRLVGFSAAILQSERPQVMAGSPGYMAGEQITGENIGPSADIFALGLLFYEMLTGHPAFNTGEPAALFSMPGEVGVLSGPDSKIPHYLAELIHRMTQRSTKDRVASCALVLKGLVEGAPPETAIPLGPEEQELALVSPTPAEPLALPDPMAAPTPDPQSDLESIFEPGAPPPAPLTPTAPPPPTHQVDAAPPPLAPSPPPATPEPAVSGAPAVPPTEAPPPAALDAPAAPRTTASGKIHMQCPKCGLVVRGLPEVFTKPIRCPDCNTESTFKPESQKADPESTTAPATEQKAAAPTVALRTSASGKIHMQCPNCGLVVRGYPEVFTKAIRCPDCNVEATFKPEPQEEEPPKPSEKTGSRWGKWPFSLKRRGK